MRLLHRMVGVVALLTFLGTGMYMRRQFPGVYHGNEAIRMMFHANHIYLLLASLLNLSLGAYLAPHAQGWRRYAQLAGSTMIVMCTAMLVAAFFTEPARGDFLHRPLTYWGIILLLPGTLLHFVAAWGRRDTN